MNARAEICRPLRQRTDIQKAPGVVDTRCLPPTTGGANKPTAPEAPVISPRIKQIKYVSEKASPIRFR
jgi:hypothetical protein